MMEYEYTLGQASYHGHRRANGKICDACGKLKHKTNYHIHEKYK
jgi:hypothetical protein